MNKIMMQIPAGQAISYPILIEENLLATPDKWLPKDWRDKNLVIITDDNVKKYYGRNLLRKLKEFKPLLLSFSPGEVSKNYHIKQSLEEQMIQHHCNRGSIIIALGGGVVGDIAGFISSTYMRGIPYIQIPTTLLAMVDSSIGGKTGINTTQGKNLIGTFWQPTCVVVDMNCLATLPKAHLINGLIEALKMFMTNDKKYFAYTSNIIDKILQRDIAALTNIVQQSIKIKIGIVSKDEKENNLRMVLNFGHTIGHAIENVTNYTLLHGYAVALGILVEAKISQLLGLLSCEEYQIIKTILFKLNISAHQLKTINAEAIIHATKVDKKRSAGNVRYILLKEIGQAYTNENMIAHSVPDEIVRRALAQINEV